MAKRTVAAVALLCLVFAPAAARELATAPEIEIIGFSRDGRTFAYEQYENDDVSAEVHAAIDVIDRDSGGSVKGFPFGFLGVQKKAEFPVRVGGHKIKKNDSDSVPAEKKLADLRAAIRRQTAARLRALKIGVRGRRLAGNTITERPGQATEIDFVWSPTLQGAVPDMQAVYRVTASFRPDDSTACANDSKSVDHTITIRIDQLYPQDEKVQSTGKAEIAWPAGDNECASGLRITDVIAAPAQTNGQSNYVVVIALAISWAPHAEMSRYFATYVKLP